MAAKQFIRPEIIFVFIRVHSWLITFRPYGRRATKSVSVSNSQTLFIWHVVYTVEERYEKQEVRYRRHLDRCLIGRRRIGAACVHFVLRFLTVMWNRSQYPRFAITASSFAFLFLLSASPLPRTGSAHEPVTTKVTFNKEVVRILQRNCLACHAPGKIKSDIPLTTYEEARPWAKAIKEEVLEKRMAPFQAVKGYGSFVHDYRVPQREVELLVSWIEGGAPRGEAKDYPKEEIDRLITSSEWELGAPDLILQPDRETMITPEGDDETRCFVLPTNLKEDRWISAIDFQPGAGTVVYSASLFLVPPSGGKVQAKAGSTNN